MVDTKDVVLQTNILLDAGGNTAGIQSISMYIPSLCCERVVPYRGNAYPNVTSVETGSEWFRHVIFLPGNEAVARAIWVLWFLPNENEPQV
jgi:hypothetical protein